MFKLPEPQGVEKELVEKVKEFWDDEEFILGTRLHLKSDEERQWVIDAIEDGELKTSDDIALYSLQIHQDRGKE